MKDQKIKGDESFCAKNNEPRMINLFYENYWSKLFKFLEDVLNLQVFIYFLADEAHTYKINGVGQICTTILSKIKIIVKMKRKIKKKLIYIVGFIL